MAQQGDISAEQIDAAVAEAYAKIAKITKPEQESDEKANGEVKPMSPEHFDASVQVLKETLFTPLLQGVVTDEPRAIPDTVRESIISYDDFAAQAKTGDLILVEAPGDVGSFLGPYGHLGMIIRGEFDGVDGNKYGRPDGLSFWHARSCPRPWEWCSGELKESSENGLVVCGAVEFELMMKQSPRIFVYARLHTNVADEDIDSRVKAFAGENMHKRFELGENIQMMLDLKSMFYGACMNTDIRPGAFTPSSLMAETLAAAGVLENLEMTKRYIPNSFSVSGAGDPCFTSNTFVHAGPITHPGQAIDYQGRSQRQSVGSQDSTGSDGGPGGMSCFFFFGRVYPDAEMDLARDSQWIRQSKQELASVASFAKLALQLQKLGAPIEIIQRCVECGEDELRHAQICKFLAELSKRRMASTTECLDLFQNCKIAAIDAHELSIGQNLNIDLFFEDVVRIGCIREAVSTCCSYAQYEGYRGNDFAKGRLLSIAADEIKHCLLAWKIVLWLASKSSKIADRLENVQWWKDEFNAAHKENVNVAAIGKHSVEKISELCWDRIIKKQIHLIRTREFSDDQFVSCVQTMWRELN